MMGAETRLSCADVFDRREGRQRGGGLQNHGCLATMRKQGKALLAALDMHVADRPLYPLFPLRYHFVDALNRPW